MRARLAALPGWATAVFQGVFFGAVMTVWDVAAEHARVLPAVAGGVLAGVFFGAWMGWIARRQRRAERRRLGGLSDEQLVLARAAALSGRPPDDRVVRAAAIRMVAYSLERHEQSRVGVLIVFGLFVAVSIAMALTEGLGYLLGSAVFVVAIVSTVRARGPLQRKLASLEADPPLVH